MQPRLYGPIHLEQEYFSQIATGSKCILDFINILAAGHHLVLLTKYPVDTKKQDLIGWLNKEDQDLFYYQCIAELIANSKLFKRNDVKGMTFMMLNLLSNHFNEEIYKEDYLKVCLLMAKKEGLNLNFLYEMLAESELKFAEKGNDDSGIVTANCYLRAALYYKKAANNKKSNQVLKMLDGHKQYIKLGLFTHQSKGKKIQDAFNSLRVEAKRIVDLKVYGPFVELGISPYILTTSDRHPENREIDFLDGIATSAYDININVKVLTPYENKMRQTFMTMTMHYEYFTLFLIYEIKKLMAEKDRDFVAEGLQYFNATWLKEELQQTILSEKPVGYNWLASLKPALSSLMALPLELNIQLTTEQQMAFDQLAIKFEGVLRDLCNLAYLTTTKVREERILAQDINELLQNKELEGVFKKDDMELWLFTFTNCGHNIRNNVAHAFYRPKDYTGQKAHLLLLCYIRIAAYGQILDKKVADPIP
jgi:hypothetical protein